MDIQAQHQHRHTLHKNNCLKIRFSSVSEGGEKNKSFCTAGGAVTSSSPYRKQYGFPLKQPIYKYNNTGA